MSTPSLMHVVEDGIIVGNVERNRHPCSNCNHTTMVIRPHRIELPPPLKPDVKLIGFRMDGKLIKHVEFLGIGCGCYAKFHRQVAHIQDRVSMRGVRRDTGERDQ